MLATKGNISGVEVFIPFHYAQQGHSGAYIQYSHYFFCRIFRQLIQT